MGKIFNFGSAWGDYFIAIAQIVNWDHHSREKLTFIDTFKKIATFLSYHIF